MDSSDILASLNIKQREAVTHIDGPLLVLAGPGTGKTQLLSARAAHILASTDANPSSILCLTFTEKAATNMRQRMLAMIGPSARTIAVHTFHGLGSEIIGQYPDYFWNGAQLKPAPEAVKLEVVETVLSKLPLSNPLALRFDGQLTQVNQSLGAIKRAKEAGLTPSKLRAIVNANLAYIDAIEPTLQPLLGERMSKTTAERLQTVMAGLPQEGTDQLLAPIPPFSTAFTHAFNVAAAAMTESGKTTALSTWKNEISEVKNGLRVLKDRRRSVWWGAIADIYEAYQAQMNSRKYFDFADMILETIVQIEANETLRSELQERYQYVMIDEFQDTNDAQFRLAYLIVNSPMHEGRPNIMAVGDDDQAIYRFQGAELSNVQTFMDSFIQTKQIVLTDNYRSHQTVIDHTATIADKIDTRLVHQLEGVSKTITAASATSAGMITHLSFASKAHALSQTAERIAEAFTAHSDVAVLARGHESLEALTAALHTKDVPVRYERRANVLEHEAIIYIMTVLRAIEAIHTGNVAYLNEAMSKITAHPMWQIQPRTLWEFAVQQRTAQNWLDGLCDHDDPKLQAIGEWLLAVSQLAATEPVPVIIEYVLGLRNQDTTSPLRNYYLTDDHAIDTQYMQTLSALQSLRQLAKEYAGTDAMTLKQFNAYIRLNTEHGVVISDDSVFATADAAVQLMTVHKAKGLEFATVFVVDCLDTIWKPGRTRSKPPVNLEALQDYGEEPDDYTRLLFVAASRAKQNLYFTSYKTNDHGTPVLASPLLHGITTKDIEPGTVQPIDIIETATAWPRLNQSDARLSTQPLLESFELPVTSLINFLDLERGGPDHFIHRNLLRLPDVKSARAAFGTAIHDALRHAQILRNQNDMQPADQRILKTFQQSLHQEGLPEDDTQKYTEHGTALLKHLLSWDAFELPVGSTAEFPFKHVSVGDARIQGKLDRIDLDSEHNTLYVVDYKTGSPLKSQLDTQTKTDGLKAWRHRTQIIFYTLLAKESGYAKPDQTITGRMVYVESESSKNLERTYTASQDDLVYMKQLINAVWQRIMHFDMPDVSEYSHDINGVLKFQADLIADYSNHKTTSAE